MGILKVKHKLLPYAQIERRMLERDDMSYEAKGLLAYLLSKPDGWSVSLTDLENRAQNATRTKRKPGRDYIRSIVRELLDLGYMVRHTVRVGGQFKGYNYDVFEDPRPATGEAKSVSGETSTGDGFAGAGSAGAGTPGDGTPAPSNNRKSSNKENEEIKNSSNKEEGGASEESSQGEKSPPSSAVPPKNISPQQGGYSENSLTLVLWNEHAKYTEHIQIGEKSAEDGYAEFVISRQEGNHGLPPTIKSYVWKLVRKWLGNTCERLREKNTLTSTSFEELAAGSLTGVDSTELPGTRSGASSYSISLLADQREILGGTVQFAVQPAENKLFSILTGFYPGPKEEATLRETCRSFALTATSAKHKTSLPGNKPSLEQQVEALQAMARDTENPKTKKELLARASELKKKMPVIYPFDSPRFLEAWSDWLAHRSKKYASNATEQQALVNLCELSRGDEGTAIAIIKQSIGNGWQGLFEIKTTNHNGATTTNQQHTNQGRGYAGLASAIIQ